jgi:hypothetical protein
VSTDSFLEPGFSYPLPRDFDFNGYIETEREMWALFPETQGKRVNFCQLGLTAQIFVEAAGSGGLSLDETYFLMPCPDRTMRPVRMKALRHMTLEEYRMTQITAMRMSERMRGTGPLMERIHMRILGPEMFEEE